MDKSPKMNILYKLSFIIMILSVVLLIAAVGLGYIMEKSWPVMVLCCVGVFLCLAAIIMTMLSKPKKPKVKKTKIKDYSEEDE